MSSEGSEAVDNIVGGSVDERIFSEPSSEETILPK